MTAVLAALPVTHGRKTRILDVHLPRPHAKQRAIRKSTAKRHVICAGRRAGKTTLVAMLAVERALAGRRELMASPTQEQADAFWEKCTAWLSAPVAAGYIYKNESLHLLRFPSGGRIRAKTAWNADSLRGDYADDLILDEYALMDPDAWDKVGAPMLLDNDGDAFFISTPKRKNHFYELYNRAVTDTVGRWAAWHFTSHDNPHLSKDALAEITSDLSEDAYKQEILAEFLEGEGAVFRNVAACMTATETTPEEHKGHRIVMGCDWGKKEDFTALSLVCANCACEVDKDRFNQIDYVFQRGRLVALVDKWHVDTIMPEANSIGGPIIEELNRDQALEDVAIMPFETTATSKPPLIESLSLAFERKECRWLPDLIWTAELEAYEMKTSAQTGRPSYGAPEGLHDDTVIARALALRGCVTAVKPMRAPGVYDPILPEPEVTRRAASEHNDSESHRRWAKKNFCTQCHEEWSQQHGS